MATMTLTEFCKKLSFNDKRVELIGGFFHYMKHVKKMERAAAEDFQKQFVEFCNAPA